MNRFLKARLAGLAVLTSACGGEAKQTASSDTEGTTSGPGSTSNDSATVAPTSSSSMPDVGVCGDGVVQPGEHCDAGAGNGQDACPVDCRFAPGTVLWSLELVSSQVNPLSLDGFDQTDVAVGDDGTIYVIGKARRNELPGQKQNVWIGAVSASGELLWSFERDGSGTGPDSPDVGPLPDDDARAIAALPGGGAIAAGTLIVEDGTYDSWVARFGGDGALLWETTFGAGGDETFDTSDLVVLGGGAGIIVGGEKNPFSGPSAAFLHRYDLSGALVAEQALMQSMGATIGSFFDLKLGSGDELWALHGMEPRVLSRRTFMGEELSQAVVPGGRRLAPGGDGGVVVIGQSGPPGPTERVFIQAFDAAGALLWAAEDDEFKNWWAITGFDYHVGEGLACYQATRAAEPKGAEVWCWRAEDGFAKRSGADGYSGGLAIDPHGLAFLVRESGEQMLVVEKVAP